MHMFSTAVRRTVRFVLVWFVDLISLVVVTAIVPGITLHGQDPFDVLVYAGAAALMLGIVNLVVRPIICCFPCPLASLLCFWWASSFTP